MATWEQYRQERMRRWLEDISVPTDERLHWRLVTGPGEPSSEPEAYPAAHAYWGSASGYSAFPENLHITHVFISDATLPGLTDDDLEDLMDEVDDLPHTDRFGQVVDQLISARDESILLVRLNGDESMPKKTQDQKDAETLRRLAGQDGLQPGEAAAMRRLADQIDPPVKTVFWEIRDRVWEAKREVGTPANVAAEGIIDMLVMKVEELPSWECRAPGHREGVTVVSLESVLDLIQSSEA